MTQNSGTAAGWYQTDAQTERWWDGQRWGPQVRAVAQPQERAPRRAVTYQRKQTNHTLHLILTVLTGGLWGVLVWLPITLINGFRREKSVTRYR